MPVGLTCESGMAIPRTTRKVGSLSRLDIHVARATRGLQRPSLRLFLGATLHGSTDDRLGPGLALERQTLGAELADAGRGIDIHSQVRGQSNGHAASARLGLQRAVPRPANHV